MTEEQEQIGHDIKEKINKSEVECPLCHHKGILDDFLFNTANYYFACTKCGILFTPLEVIEGLKRLVALTKRNKKENQ